MDSPPDAASAPQDASGAAAPGSLGAPPPPAPEPLPSVPAEEPGGSTRPWEVPAATEIPSSASGPAWAPIGGDDPYDAGEPGNAGGLPGPAASVASTANDRPEIVTGLAFAGGLAAAIILRRLGS